MERAAPSTNPATTVTAGTADTASNSVTNAAEVSSASTNSSKVWKEVERWTVSIGSKIIKVDWK